MSKVKHLILVPPHKKPAPILSQAFFAFSINRKLIFKNCSGSKLWSQTLTPYSIQLIRSVNTTFKIYLDSDDLPLLSTSLQPEFRPPSPPPGLLQPFPSSSPDPPTVCFSLHSFLQKHYLGSGHFPWRPVSNQSTSQSSLQSS